LRHLDVSGRIHLTGGVMDAFQFFTPEGERAWVPGWVPEYLHPPGGDLVQGLTFRTRHLGGEITLWLVTHCDASAGEIDYVRVTPDSRMGIVSIRVSAVAAGECEAAVAYRLTALSPAGATAIDRFGGSFTAMLESWERAVNACLAER
jgi:hypothetical protein